MIFTFSNDLYSKMIDKTLHVLKTKNAHHIYI